MTIETEIKSNVLHEGIHQLKEHGVVIGYLKESTAVDKSAIVTPDGKNLGDFCCDHHAVEAAWLHHHNIHQRTERRERIPRSLLVMALMAMMSR
ncbi:hypothetical protein GW590_08420 [Rahnella sp. SAP-1]|uniref:Uncharacterized protein n=1 Tax=Rouxiella aceris TaxID=2703884 RepID=A0A848MFE9_9GAMM|nr:hypothetical protein [Rouxiella aceris]NMP26887.1 hypothetical protein [Rouxiella aceris]